MNEVKTAFFGSSVYSLPYLDFLAQNRLLRLALVVSQPDKSFGRGLKTAPTPVKVWAQAKKILCLTPRDLSEKLFLGTLKTLAPSLGLAVYYGLKIPRPVIELFSKGILNLHHSLLPKHRGANPIAWAIVKGDEKTGTTLIRINEKFDEGEIVAYATEEITNDDTSQSLRRRLDQKALELLGKSLNEYLEDRLKPWRQDPAAGGYEPKITKEMARIDWSEPTDLIERKIRAFYPWPISWTTLKELDSKLNEKRIKIIKARLSETKELIIEKVQIEGKGPINWKEFKNGYLNSKLN